VRVGISLTPDQRRVAATARWAEQAGFDYLACGEHLFFHIPTPNAFVALAAAAGATEHIRLLSALTVLPLYPAVVAAKLAATLDQVSNGRFDFGVGVGGEFPPEFAAAGIPVHERGRRTDEALELILKLFSGERVDHIGRWTQVPGLTLTPPAVQRPHPPVWVGGRREAAFRRAGRFADHWMPYLYTPEQFERSLKAVRGYASDHGRTDVIHGAVFCWGAIDHDPRVARRDAVTAVSGTYNQDFEDMADRYLVTGSPAGVVARLLEFADAGAETVIFAGPKEPDAWKRTTDLLERDVVPALRSRTV
jgi:probable F420-dependent oxidoreductase